MATQGLMTATPSGPTEYEELCHRVQRTICDATPQGAVVAIVSKGDPRLLELDGRSGCHFPVDATGAYAGFHPKTAEDAVAHIESLRGSGVRFFCLPATAFWWLDHYRGLTAWLNAHCRLVAREPDSCVVFDLHEPPQAPAAGEHPEGTVGRPAPGVMAQARAILDALLPAEALVLVLGSDGDGLSRPGRKIESLLLVDVTVPRRLASIKEDCSTFILVLGASLDPDLEVFLARRTELIAHREHVCNLLRVRPFTAATTVGPRAAGPEPTPPHEP